MQSLGIASLLWAIECFKDPSKETKISSTKLGNIIWGILNLIWGLALIWMFGYFLIFADFPTGNNLSIWSIPISILIICFLYFYLPKTKIWKNRGKAKQPLADSFNLLFRLIGQGIMLIGAGHIVFAIYVWLKIGVWKTIALGDWGITIFTLGDYNRFDTGWWAANQILNYIILDSSAALPLIVMGYVIYVSASDD
jgi:hypothetical protein